MDGYDWPGALRIWPADDYDTTITDYTPPTGRRPIRSSRLTIEEAGPSDEDDAEAYTETAPILELKKTGRVPDDIFLEQPKLTSGSIIKAADLPLTGQPVERFAAVSIAASSSGLTKSVIIKSAVNLTLRGATSRAVHCSQSLEPPFDRRLQQR